MEKYRVWICNKEDGWDQARYVPCNTKKEVHDVILSIDHEYELYDVETTVYPGESEMWY